MHESLSPICVEIYNYKINILLTMIEGKVHNAITYTDSAWTCSICGMKKSEFTQTSSNIPINRDTLHFGISPLHARIRFLEFMLHISYDLKYRCIPGNEEKSVRNNNELIEMRGNEKNSN